MSQEHQQLTKEEVAERLQKATEDTFALGYVSGLKSVLPFVEKISKELSQIHESILDYIVKNDPNHKKSDEQIAKEAEEATKKLNDQYIKAN